VQVVRQLRALTDAEVSIAMPSPARFNVGQYAENVRLIPLDIDQEDQEFPAISFGNQLEELFSHERPDLIVHDCNPVRWLSTTRFPNCPRVCVTNFFLTRLANLPTDQKLSFSRYGNLIKNERSRKGMPVMKDAYEGYEADQVLLADPPILVDSFEATSHRYHACGACWWEAAGNLPPELEQLDNFLLCSLGSTGKKLNDHFVRKVADKYGCRDIVIAQACTKGENVRKVGSHTIYSYKSVPLSRLVPKAGAIITQGGAGSTYQALAAGKPVVIVPTHTNHALLGRLLSKQRLAYMYTKNWKLGLLSRDAVEKMRSEISRIGPQSVENSGPGAIATRIADLVTA